MKNQLLLHLAKMTHADFSEDPFFFSTNQSFGKSGKICKLMANHFEKTINSISIDTKSLAAYLYGCAYMLNPANLSEFQAICRFVPHLNFHTKPGN